jgi:enediyne biosynthesis protein E4
VQKLRRLLGLLAVPLLAGCPGGVKPSAAPPSTETPGLRFEDHQEKSGLNFTYSLPGPRPITILQSMPGGCAFLDYDRDGNLDLLCISYSIALFRGDGTGKFTDVTTSAGLQLPDGWWMGVAVGDYDNDGWDDIYLSKYEGGQLFHNESGKKFTDKTKIAGIKSQAWGSSCTFGDYNGDGKLDLFVGNYVEFNKDTIQLCPVKNIKTSCSPTVYNPLFGSLYQNSGAGKFTNVTSKVLPNNVSGKVLGSHFVDFDGSGRQSLYLANDETPADLLHNLKTGFKNIAEPAGVGYQDDGKPFGGMGGDWADFNEDSKIDLFLGTFAMENKMLFVNESDSLFTDRSAALGIAQPAMLSVTFGAKWLDADNDGDLDLMLANGYIADNIALYEPSRTYRQKTLLFESEEGERFTERSATAGEALLRPLVGRGLATGDYDNDGRVDAFVVDSEGKPLLLHNESATATGRHWVSLKLEGNGTTSNRSGYGAMVWIEANGKKRMRHCHADGSYFSSSDPRIHVGVGAATSAVVTVRWPSGKKESFPVPADKTVPLKEGTGKPL